MQPRAEGQIRTSTAAQLTSLTRSQSSSMLHKALRRGGTLHLQAWSCNVVCSSPWKRLKFQNGGGGRGIVSCARTLALSLDGAELIAPAARAPILCLGGVPQREATALQSLQQLKQRSAVAVHHLVLAARMHTCSGPAMRGRHAPVIDALCTLFASHDASIRRDTARASHRTHTYTHTSN
jgi:hypothetical protein